MALKADQLIVYRADIDANSGPGGEFENVPMNDDGHRLITDAYNLEGVPTNWVFGVGVPYSRLKLGIDYAEYEVLSQGERDSWIALTGDLLGAGGGLDAADRRVRDAFIAIFPPSAPNSRAGLLDEISRPGLRGENLFSIDASGPGGGNGSGQQAAQELVHVGFLTLEDTKSARNL